MGRCARQCSVGSRDQARFQLCIEASMAIDMADEEEYGAQRNRGKGLMP